MEKVYCKDCKHCKKFNQPFPLCKKNRTNVDDFYGKNIKYEYCIDENKNNDCKDYEPNFIKRILNILK